MSFACVFVAGGRSIIILSLFLCGKEQSSFSFFARIFVTRFIPLPFTQGALLLFFFTTMHVKVGRQCRGGVSGPLQVRYRSFLYVPKM